MILACRNIRTKSTETTTKLLIEAGADLNKQDKFGCTALMKASSYSNEDSQENAVVTKMLFKHFLSILKKT